MSGDDDIIDVEYTELDEHGEPVVESAYSVRFDGVIVPGVPSPPDAPRPVG